MDNLKLIDELRRNLNELRELGTSLKKFLIEIGEVIDDETFATEASLEVWSTTLLDWMKKTTACIDLYEQIFGQDLPNKFTDVEKLLDAEEKKILDANVFENAKKFMRFVTKAPDLKKNLREHQAKLKKLLARKRQTPQLKAILEPYAKFVVASEEKDFGKKFATGKELSEIFGDTFVGRGLFGSEFILTTLDAMNEENLSLPPEKNIPEVDSQDSDFVKRLYSRSAFLRKSAFDRWEKCFTIENKENSKDFSASRFKREFNNPEMLKTVLRYILFKGMLWLPSFYPQKMPLNVVDSVTQMLFNKGYLRKYTFKGLGSFYGFTFEFAEFLWTDNGKKFITNSKFVDKVEFNNRPFISNNIKIALTRMIFFRVHYVMTVHDNIFQSVDFFPQTFRAEFSNEYEYNVFLGCFWDTPVDSDIFLKKLRDWLHKINKLTRMFVVGFTPEHAKKIFDSIEESLENDFPKRTALYLYTFSNNNFYRKDNLERVLEEEIWKIPTLDDDSTLEESSKSEENLEIQKAEPLAIDAETKEKILNDVNNLILNEKFYCATAYLKAKTLTIPEVEPLYRQLAFAVDDPFLNEGYSANAILILASRGDEVFNEALITAAALRAIFYNDFGNDYGIPALDALINSFEIVNSNESLIELIRDLRNFKAIVRKGIDFYADYRTKDKVVAEKNLVRVITAAEDYYTRFFERHVTDNAYNETFIRLKQNIFARNGDLAKIFRAIKEKNKVNSADTLDIVKKFLSEFFLVQDADFKTVNLDANKMEQFITDKWYAVCDKKSPGRLTGELKNNITKNLERAVEIMCAWVQCAEIFSASSEDSGSIEYRKIHSRLVGNIKSARKTLKGNFGAGGIVVNKTLVELSARLTGNFNPLDRKYFYVQFLCSDKIVLDENYLPKLDLNTSDGTQEEVFEQILEHATLKLPSFEKRIEQIFEAGGDDFGSAQLIDDYLKAVNGKSFIAAKEYDLKKCIDSAAKDMPSYKESLIGGLELAQSYGQFDTMPESSKEIILQLAENCYEYAEQSKNFGVFFRVKKHWENVIEKNAASYAQNLKNELQTASESFKSVTQNFDATELNDSINEIDKIIASGNFTIARSLIVKLSNGELYKKFDETEDTALSRFISDYSDCYNKIYDNAYTLEALLTKTISTQDKVSHAKLNLVKSWIANPVTEDKIKTLLELLGFTVDSVLKITSSDETTINFNIKISSTAQVKYYHPIAAFGSDAEAEGFRVSCIFGRYDEKNLIAKFKELDNSKNTLIFLDYALDLPTRRRLAKDIKLDNSLIKVFAVVDRVNIMYLLKNCAEQIGTKRINDTLMALIMPFARYQPYIWSPKSPLPPEMFIGRENEINEVMNQGGVNIVCGGRQLGKSALLKMACRKIEGLNNQRAIYLEIAGKNYKEAALFISRELSDKDFFAEPFKTDNWEKLTRAIKNRLASETPNKIPYFLLMLDEADKFIESCAENNYAPIVALAKIQQENHNGNHFKFVISGLRNIVRFEHDKTLSNNNILPTLKSLTIKPFSLEDARKLLEVPLKYLGLYFPDSNKDSLILTILETTNYFPSLIQLYCEKLVKALFETSYAGYNADTPIYNISEDHIKKILADNDFIKDIKTKIEITLGLGSDKYYSVLANLLAYLYYNESNLDGYSPHDILKAAKDLELINKATFPDSEEKISALMEELCDLNILRKLNEGKYLFSRQRILRIVGTRNEVTDMLLKFATEIEHG